MAGHFGGIDCIADCDTYDEATNFVNLLMAMFKGMFMMQTTEAPVKIVRERDTYNPEG